MIPVYVNIHIWMVSVFLGVLFTHPVISYGIEDETPGSDRDLFSIDYAETNLDLSLLGTITREGFGTAIIKNHTTGELRKFAEGDTIYLTDKEKGRILKIANCMVLIQRGERYETLSCNTGGSYYNQELALNPSAPSALGRYRIAGESDKKKNRIPKFSSKYEKEIEDASIRYDVDPYLVKAVIKVESNFNPNAVSPKNAVGIMQLMPETAEDYGVDDPFDPVANIDGGVRFLRDLMDYFEGDVELALAAYNAGRGAVVKHGFTIPPYNETLDYVEKVLGHYSLLKWNRYEKK